MSMLNPRLGTLVALIVVAAATRLLPHPPNLTSLTAVALFGGAYFTDRRLAFAVPFIALLLSDLTLGWYYSWSFMAFQPHMWVQYFAFALVVMLGMSLREDSGALRIGGTTLAASCAFFVVTNFGEWVFQPWYPKTGQGLVDAYVAAIPFFRNTLLGDALYVALLFGGFRMLERNFAGLRAQPERLAHAK
jgi:hypothetical protein